MPSKSLAQRKKMAVLHRQGKITGEQWRHFKVIKPNRRKKVGGKKKK